MKSILNLAAWLCVAALALYVALWAGGGVVFSGPLGTLGVGLIGFTIWQLSFLKKVEFRRAETN